jgi:hemerythrin-like metal-binding protein
MAYFEWDKALDVGVEEMNQQHKTLIGLMDVVYQKNESGASKQEIVGSIDNLVNFVLKHFKDEEGYMASINFPGLEAHKKVHGNLLTDISKLVEGFKNGTAEKLGSDFPIFLKFWLSTHIRGIDTKYGFR